MAIEARFSNSHSVNKDQSSVRFPMTCVLSGTKASLVKDWKHWNALLRLMWVVFSVVMASIFSRVFWMRMSLAGILTLSNIPMLSSLAKMKGMPVINWQQAITECWSATQRTKSTCRIFPYQRVLSAKNSPKIWVNSSSPKTNCLRNPDQTTLRNSHGLPLSSITSKLKK